MKCQATHLGIKTEEVWRCPDCKEAGQMQQADWIETEGASTRCTKIHALDTFYCGNCLHLSRSAKGEEAVYRTAEAVERLQKKAHRAVFVTKKCRCCKGTGKREYLRNEDTGAP